MRCIGVDISIRESITTGALSTYSVKRRPLMELGPLGDQVPPQDKEAAIHVSNSCQLKQTG